MEIVSKALRKQMEDEYFLASLNYCTVHRAY